MNVIRPRACNLTGGTPMKVHGQEYQMCKDCADLRRRVEAWVGCDEGGGGVNKIMVTICSVLIGYSIMSAVGLWTGLYSANLPNVGIGAIWLCVGLLSFIKLLDYF